MDSGIGIGGLSVGQDEYASGCFDLFKEVEIENSIAHVTRITTRPISVATSRGPFIFEIPADSEKFTEAESFRLHGSMRIRKKEDGEIKNIIATDKVSTVNNIFHSLWSKVIVNLNDVAINDPTNSWYAYKAYFENHLSYSKGTKTSLLDYRGYFIDTCNEFDDVGKESDGIYTDSKNEGFKKRLEIFAESNWVYFCINVHSDITTLRKYIPPGIKIKFDFQRNDDKFSLLSHHKLTEFVIEFGEMQMSCKRYKPAKTFQNFYNSQLKSGNNSLKHML